MVSMALFFVASIQAHGYDGLEFPFTVRKDLAPKKTMERAELPITSFDLEKYLAATLDYGDSVLKAEPARKERSWNEIRYGTVHLSVSRYNDEGLPKVAAQSAGDGTFWQGVKSLSTQLSAEGLTRNSLETMGKIFTPQVSLGIEF